MTTYLDVAGEQADRSGLAVLVDPETVLHQSTDVVLDARKARLLQTTAPQRTEDRQRKVDLSVVDADAAWSSAAPTSVPPMVDDIYVSPTEPDDATGSFMLTTRWRKGEPMLSLGTPSGDRHVRHPRAAGQHARHRDATPLRRSTPGNGAAADYAAVDAPGQDRGRRAQRRGRSEERARAAAAAGAKALIVVNDGIGGLNEYVGDVTDPGRHRAPRRRRDPDRDGQERARS